MVFDRYVASIISAYLGNFIKGVNKDTVKISLLKGSVELKDVEFSPSILSFSKHIRLKRGIIGHLTVKIPWRSLYSKRCEIHIKDVVFVLSPRLRSATDEATMEEENLANILQFELSDVMESENSDSDDNSDGKKDGFFKRLQKRILNNFAFVIENVTIRLEDKLGLWKGKGVSFVAHLKNVHCEATDSGFNPTFLAETPDELFRTLAYSGATCHISVLPKDHFSNDIAWDSMSLADFKARCTDISSMECVVRPCSGTVNVHYALDPTEKIERPFAKIIAKIETGDIVVQEHAAMSMRIMAHTISHAGKIVEQRRPPIRPCKENIIAWWKYIALEFQKRKKQKFEWESFLKWKAAYKTYFDFYLRQLDAPWVIELGKALPTCNVEDAKKKLTVQDVAECRARARFAVAKYNVDRVIPAWTANPNFFNEAIPAAKALSFSSSVDVIVYATWPSFRLLVDENVEAQVQNFTLAASLKKSHAVVETTVERVLLSANEENVLTLGGHKESVDGFSLQSVIDTNDFKSTTAITLGSLGLQYNEVLHNVMRKRFAHYLEMGLLDLPPQDADADLSPQPSPPPPKPTAEAPQAPALHLTGTDVSVRLHYTSVNANGVIINVHDMHANTQSKPLALHVTEVTAFDSVTQTHIAVVDNIIVCPPAKPDEAISVTCGALLHANLEGIERLKEFGAFIMNPDIEDRRKKKKKTVDLTPLRLNVTLTTARFEALEMRQLRISVFLFNGWNIRLQSDYLIMSNWHSAETNLDLELWADSCLATSPFGDWIDEDGIGFQFSLQDANLLLDTALANTLESLFDLLILVAFLEEDPHVYLRDEAHTIPHIRGSVACSDCHLRLVDDFQMLKEFRIDADGVSSIYVELQRFRDKHMDVTVKLGPGVDGFLRDTPYPIHLLPVRDHGGDINVALHLASPTPEAACSFPYATISIDVDMTERAIVAHLPTIMTLWNQFNTRGMPLWLLRNVGSRVHYSCRSAREGRCKPPASPTSVDMQERGEAAFVQGTFGHPPPPNPDPYSSATFPGDLVLNVAATNSELYYVMGDCSLVPLFLHAFVPLCNVCITNRDGLARAEVTGALSFPYVSLGTAEAHPEQRKRLRLVRGRQKRESQRRASGMHFNNLTPFPSTVSCFQEEDDKEQFIQREEYMNRPFFPAPGTSTDKSGTGIHTTHGNSRTSSVVPPTYVSAKIIYTNDNRPPFDDGVANEVLSFYFSGCDYTVPGSVTKDGAQATGNSAQGPILLRLREADVAGWRTLLSFYSAATNEKDVFYSNNHMHPLWEQQLLQQQRTKRFVIRVRIGYGAIYLPTMGLAVALWDGMDMSFTLPAMQIELPRLTVLSHDSLLRTTTGELSAGAEAATPITMAYLQLLYMEGEAVVVHLSGGNPKQPPAPGTQRQDAEEGTEKQTPVMEGFGKRYEEADQGGRVCGLLLHRYVTSITREETATAHEVTYVLHKQVKIAQCSSCLSQTMLVRLARHAFLQEGVQYIRSLREAQERVMVEMLTARRAAGYSYTPPELNLERFGASPPLPLLNINVVAKSVTELEGVRIAILWESEFTHKGKLAAAVVTDNRNRNPLQGPTSATSSGSEDDEEAEGEDEEEDDDSARGGVLRRLSADCIGLLGFVSRVQWITTIAAPQPVSDDQVAGASVAASGEDDKEKDSKNDISSPLRSSGTFSAAAAAAAADGGESFNSVDHLTVAEVVMFLGVGFESGIHHFLNNDATTTHVPRVLLQLMNDDPTAMTASNYLNDVSCDNGTATLHEQFYILPFWSSLFPILEPVRVHTSSVTAPKTLNHSNRIKPEPLPASHQVHVSPVRLVLTPTTYHYIRDLPQRLAVEKVIQENEEHEDMGDDGLSQRGASSYKAGNYSGGNSTKHIDFKKVMQKKKKRKGEDERVLPSARTWVSPSEYQKKQMERRAKKKMRQLHKGEKRMSKNLSIDDLLHYADPPSLSYQYVYDAKAMSQRLSMMDNCFIHPHAAPTRAFITTNSSYNSGLPKEGPPPAFEEKECKDQTFRFHQRRASSSIVEEEGTSKKKHSTSEKHSETEGPAATSDRDFASPSSQSASLKQQRGTASLSGSTRLYSARTESVVGSGSVSCTRTAANISADGDDAEFALLTSQPSSTLIEIVRGDRKYTETFTDSAVDDARGVELHSASESYSDLLASEDPFSRSDRQSSQKRRQQQEQDKKQKTGKGEGGDERRQGTIKAALEVSPINRTNFQGSSVSTLTPRSSSTAEQVSEPEEEMSEAVAAAKGKDSKTATPAVDAASKEKESQTMRTTPAAVASMVLSHVCVPEIVFAMLDLSEEEELALLEDVHRRVCASTCDEIQQEDEGEMLTAPAAIARNRAAVVAAATAAAAAPANSDSLLSKFFALSSSKASTISALRTSSDSRTTDGSVPPLMMIALSTDGGAPSARCKQMMVHVQGLVWRGCTDATRVEVAELACTVHYRHVPLLAVERIRVKIPSGHTMMPYATYVATREGHANTPTTPTASAAAAASDKGFGNGRSNDTNADNGGGNVKSNNGGGASEGALNAEEEKARVHEEGVFEASKISCSLKPSAILYCVDLFVAHPNKRPSLLQRIQRQASDRASRASSSDSRRGESGGAHSTLTSRQSGKNSAKERGGGGGGADKEKERRRSASGPISAGSPTKGKGSKTVQKKTTKKGARDQLVLTRISEPTYLLESTSTLNPKKCVLLFTNTATNHITVDLQQHTLVFEETSWSIYYYSATGDRDAASDDGRKSGAPGNWTERCVIFIMDSLTVSFTNGFFRLPYRERRLRHNATRNRPKGQDKGRDDYSNHIANALAPFMVIGEGSFIECDETVKLRYIGGGGGEGGSGARGDRQALEHSTASSAASRGQDNLFARSLTSPLLSGSPDGSGTRSFGHAASTPSIDRLMGADDVFSPLIVPENASESETESNSTCSDSEEEETGGSKETRSPATTTRGKQRGGRREGQSKMPLLHVIRKFRLAIKTIDVQVHPQNEVRMLQILASLDVTQRVDQGAMEAGEMQLRRLTIRTRWLNVSSAITANTTLLLPVDVNVSLSESRHRAISCGAVVVDLMRGDVLLLRQLLASVQGLVKELRYIACSAEEKELRQLVEQLTKWRKEVPVTGSMNEEDKAELPRDESSTSIGSRQTSGQAASRLPSGTSTALFLPSLELTLSDLRFPMLRATVKDILLRAVAPSPAVHTLHAQCLHLHVEVYGKGRWDTVVLPRGLISWSRTQTSAVHSTNDHISLGSDGVQVQCSHLILGKMLYVAGQLPSFFQSEGSSAAAAAGGRESIEMRQLSDETPLGSADEDLDVQDSTAIQESQSYARRATHRFINSFNCTFFVVVARSLTSDDADVYKLAPSSTLDVFIPYHRAKELSVFFFPEESGQWSDHRGVYEIQDAAKRAAAEAQSLPGMTVNTLQYGYTTGLVVDTTLVVVTCADQRDVAEAYNVDSAEVVTSQPQQGVETQAAWTASQVQSAGGGGTTISSSSARTKSAEAHDDEAGLVVVRMHAKAALRNETGIALTVCQRLMEEEDDDSKLNRAVRRRRHTAVPLPAASGGVSRVFDGLPPRAQLPLKSTCGRVILRATEQGRTYECSYSVLDAPPSCFIAMYPTSELQPTAASTAAAHRGDAPEEGEEGSSAYYCPPVRPSARDQRPIMLFVVCRRLSESLSSTITLFPRLMVVNHTGVPIRLAMWQRDRRAGPQVRGDTDLMKPWLPEDSGPDSDEANQSLVALGAHCNLQHRQALSVLQCTYSSNLVLALSLSQVTGETLRTENLCTVVTNLHQSVEHHPRLLPLRDENGQTFYVQVAVLARTIILSVALWVCNLTDYPILATESLITRRLFAGLPSNTGILPSQGMPFLIGCRMQDFTQAFFKVGLDGRWSPAVPMDVGSAGVFESFSKLGIPRSCNYAIQLPNAQEGRPIVLRITPRWVIVNTTLNKRLQVYFDCPALRAGLREAQQKKDAARVTAFEDVMTVRLNPGEHYVSCVGTVDNNQVAVCDRLERMVPSFTSISDRGVSHRNVLQYYESQRTAYLSMDRPGQATLNLWAARKPLGKQMGVSYGGELEVYRAARYDPIALDPFDPYNSTDAVVTGRLTVSMQEVEHVLAIVFQGVHATKINIQNRTLDRTVMVRQEGNRRRNMVPARQNRFFLWEDSRGEHVIRVHVTGYKGYWFEVDFARGDCRVTRHATPTLQGRLDAYEAQRRRGSATAAAGGGGEGMTEEEAALYHIPFFVKGFTNAEKTIVTVLITSRPLPVHAAIGTFRASKMLECRLSFFKATWLCESVALARYMLPVGHHRHHAHRDGAGTLAKASTSSKKSEDVVVNGTNASEPQSGSKSGPHSGSDEAEDDEVLRSTRPLVSLVLEGLEMQWLDSMDNQTSYVAIHQLQMIDEAQHKVSVYRARWRSFQRDQEQQLLIQQQQEEKKKRALEDEEEEMKRCSRANSLSAESSTSSPLSPRATLSSQYLFSPSSTATTPRNMLASNKSFAWLSPRMKGMKSGTTSPAAQRSPTASAERRPNDDAPDDGAPPVLTPPSFLGRQLPGVAAMSGLATAAAQRFRQMRGALPDFIALPFTSRRRDHGKDELANDFKMEMTLIKYADGVVRITDFDACITPLVVVLSDLWLVAALMEGRRVQQLFAQRSAAAAHRRHSPATAPLAATNNPHHALLSTAHHLLATTGTVPPEYTSQSNFVLQLVSLVQQQQSDKAVAGTLAAGVEESEAAQTQNRRRRVGGSTAVYKRPPGAAEEGGAADRGDGEGATQTFIFIQRFNVSRVTLYLTFVRHRPDPLRSVLGAYTMMLPRQLRGKEFHLRPLTITQQVETTRTIHGRLLRWAVQSLRSQWTKVTKIGTVLDWLHDSYHALPVLCGGEGGGSKKGVLRGAPVALTYQRVQDLRSAAAAKHRGAIDFISEEDEDEDVDKETSENVRWYGGADWSWREEGDDTATESEEEEEQEEEHSPSRGREDATAEKWGGGGGATAAHGSAPAAASAIKQGNSAQPNSPGITTPSRRSVRFRDDGDSDYENTSSPVVVQIDDSK